MAKKKTSLSQTLFGQIDPYGTTPEEPVLAAGVPATLPLTVIRPDPDQPRQLLPPDLSRALADGQIAPAEALRAWMEQANETKPESTPRPIREIRRLADSLAQHGLINPITVRPARSDERLPAGVEYIIITGERRYWSHVLLAGQERGIREGAEVSPADHIKAFVAQAGVSIRAHQLIENLMREDINAVEKARGLWALRYELSGVNHGSPPAGTVESDPVNHGSQAEPEPDTKLVPWSQVEEAVDISKRYRIFITGVLDLSADAQRLVAENDLSERTIRPIVQKLKGRPDLQVEALQQLVQWDKSQDQEGEARPPLVASTEALVSELLNRAGAEESATPARKPAPPARHPLGTEQFRNKIQSALRFLNKMEEPDLINLTLDLADTTRYAETVEELRDLRERINAILEAVDIHSGQFDRPR